MEAKLFHLDETDTKDAEYALGLDGSPQKKKPPTKNWPEASMGSNRVEITPQPSCAWAVITVSVSLFCWVPGCWRKTRCSAASSRTDNQ